MVEVLHAPHPELGGLLLVGGEHLQEIEKERGGKERASEETTREWYVGTDKNAHEGDEHTHRQRGRARAQEREGEREREQRRERERERKREREIWQPIPTHR